jgi:hypothetical protein
MRYAYVGQEEGFQTYILQADVVIRNMLGRHVYFYGRGRSKNQNTKIVEGSLNPQMEYIAG